MEVIKRNKSKQEFNLNKIINAINKALTACNMDIIQDTDKDIIGKLKGWLKLHLKEVCQVEEIQDCVEQFLYYYFPYNVTKAYILYRAKRAECRETSVLNQVSGLFDKSDEYLMKENANKKTELTNVQQSYLSGILSTHYNRTKVFSKDVLDAHDKGAIHIHDLDTCAMPGITNCSLLNLYDCLYDGTVMNDVMIDPQKRFVTACTVATQIIQGVAGLQYGGITVTMSHLVPALMSEFDFILQNSQKYFGKVKHEYVDAEYKKAIKDGIQTFMYQVNSMYTTQGWVWPL